MAKSTAEDVKLLGRWESPYVVRAGIALNLKGIEYEFIEDPIKPKSELLLESNPVYKKIPVLFHGDKTICESTIIVQYIDEVWGSTEGPSILPSDAYERAIARFWASYIDDKLLPSLLSILRRKTEEEKEEATANAITGLQLLEEAFEKCSKGKQFFGGDTINYIDIALGSYVGWLEAMKELAGCEFLDEVKTPCIVNWAKNFRLNEAVKEVLLETSKFVEYGKMLQAMMFNAQSTE